MLKPANRLFAGCDSTASVKGHSAFFTEHDITFNMVYIYTRSKNAASLLNIMPVDADADGSPTMEGQQDYLKR